MSTESQLLWDSERSSNKRVGQVLPIPNRLITHLGFYIARSGTSPLAYEFRIYTTADPNTVAATTGSQVFNDLSDTPHWEIVPLETPIAFNEEVFICVVRALSSGTYVRVFFQDSNVKGGENLAYSSDYVGLPTEDATKDCAYQYYYGPGPPPVVTTQLCTDIDHNSGTGHGNVTDLGTSAVTQHGHCWSEAHNPTTADFKTTLGAKAATGPSLQR